MGAMTSQTISLTIVYSTFISGADQRKHQRSSPLAFLLGNSPKIGVFPEQMASNAEKFSFDGVIMYSCYPCYRWQPCHQRSNNWFLMFTTNFAATLFQPQRTWWNWYVIKSTYFVNLMTYTQRYLWIHQFLWLNAGYTQSLLNHNETQLHSNCVKIICVPFSLTWINLSASMDE